MTVRQFLRALAALMFVPAATLAADPPSAAPDKPDGAGSATAEDTGHVWNYLVLPEPGTRQLDIRFGWWAMWQHGSPAKVGEYQDTKSSPFFDVDGLLSDGSRTLDFSITGTDNEDTSAYLTFYRPGFKAYVEYQRFPHELDHDPLSNMGNPADTWLNPPTNTIPKPNSSDPKTIKEDLNVGKDYALRVQELKSSFKGQLTDNLKVRLDVWGMEKQGIRQANAVAKCYANTAGNGVTNLPPDHLQTFGGNKCHVLSQAQNIDWSTSEIKPVLEARLGDSITLEYSRPMRSFTTRDQTVTRFYDRVGVLSYDPANPILKNPLPYDVAPESYTQMDQVKIGASLGEHTKAYANSMAGDTVDREINMARWFNNVDMRVTNNSLESIKATGYGTIYNEDEEMPQLSKLPPEDVFVRNGRLVHPIDYHKSSAGLKGAWRPGGGGYAMGGLAVAAGYEYCDLDRAYAIFTSPTNATPANVKAEIDESHTITHSFQVGPDYRWSSHLDTFIRYKFQNAVQPLIGFKQDNGVFNTMLPQHDHIVEIGFNWTPADWFILNASIGVERADNHSQPAEVAQAWQNINFDEENYPISLTAWYAYSKRLSFSAGYSVFSNFVAQNVVIGDDPAPYSASSIQPVNPRWSYGGQAHVVTLGSRYCATERVTLTGEFEWVHGRDKITTSTTTFPASGVTVSDYGSLSEVLNQSTRVRVGVDWMLRPRVVTYCRYELYNFDDQTPGYQSGWAQGILGGFSALF